VWQGVSPGFVKSLTSVLPPEARVIVSGKRRVDYFGLSVPGQSGASQTLGTLAVAAERRVEHPVRVGPGGVRAEDVRAFLGAGASAIAVGSTLFSPGCSLTDLRQRAEEYVGHWGDHMWDVTAGAPPEEVRLASR
jgi:hypothetical protein